MQNINDLTLNIISLLAKKIVVPSGFHARATAVKEMLNSDVSGIVDSLTDFQVNSATVDFSIESDNENLTKILKKWLDKINIEYSGQVPSGIKPLSKEYFKERWKGSSFPVLKIAGWTRIDGIMVPSKMFFVDGSSVYAKDKDENETVKKLINYDYYLGRDTDDKLTTNNSIITKPFGRWSDAYPDNYLIKRGVYQNWKILESIKNREAEILEQIIPYLLLIKKGTERLAADNIKTYTDKELKQVTQDFQNVVDELKGFDLKKKSTVRASNFDEEIKHLIPDLKGIFDSGLFTSLEKHMLSGLGFIDSTELSATSRRESILNPKVFVEETKEGVNDFKQILKTLAFKIQEKNKQNIKYMNSEFYITSSPVTAFVTDEFKRQVQRLWRSGRLSDQTVIELVGEVDFKTEVYRRKKEGEKDLFKIFYPPVAENREQHPFTRENDPTTKKKETPEEDEKGDPVPEDKRDETEKKEYDVGQKVLEISPYERVEDLPKNVKTSLTPDLQRIWKKAFNNAYERTKNDEQARKAAWGAISRIAKKDKDGNWVKKSHYASIEDLPDRVKNNMSKSLQEKFLKIVNKELENYGSDNDAKVFENTWHTVKKIAKKQKDGKWVLDKKTILENLIDFIIQNEN